MRVTPNAGREAVEGVELRDDGRTVLRLRVSAVPDRGRANAAAVQLIARVLYVPKSAVRLVSGETARLKTLAVDGTPAELGGRIEALR